MGNSNAQNMFELGQIMNERNRFGVMLTLSYSAGENFRLSIIIQNKLGMAVFEDNLDINASSDRIQFQIPDVTGGDYNAWIDVKGEVFIRNITITPRPNNGLFGWLKLKLL